jgi:ABC-type uncharacterized transport system ATPase subunit
MINTPSTISEHAFSMHGISKTFGSVLANEDIDFDVRRGEIHALLGENGSGKSTLMNILSGIYQPDKGVIEIDGAARIFHSPKDSIRYGIGMVYQHFMLAEALTAAENIAAGTKGFFRNKKLESDTIRAFSATYGMEINPDTVTNMLSVSEKQTVEILKVLYRGARILVLDEPTAVLTPQEIRRLFDVLRKMRDNGCSIVFISHKLNEVMDLCDRVTVLRKGRSIETCNIADIESYDLVEKMVGRKIDLSIDRPEPNPLQDKCLQIEDLSLLDENGYTKLKNISFQLRYGEMLGVAGLAGGGQKELCEAIAGIIPTESGRIIFDGANIAGKSPREIIRMGVSMSFIPEDRLGMGLVASMDIADNILLKDYSFQKGPFLHTADVRKKAEKIVEELDIMTPGIFHPVRKLSGGNIQKVILGREINLSPKLLITAYAVRGLDINSSYTIYNLLNEQKKKNVAILYIGEDLDVLLELCDRIMVLYAGGITGIVDARTVTKEEIGQMMSGTKLEDIKERGNL